MRIVFEKQFQRDYKQVVRHQPRIKDELCVLIKEIEEIGTHKDLFQGKKL